MADDHVATGADSEAVDHGITPGKVACRNFCADEQTGVVKQKVDAPASYSRRA